jgi:hypothetical protein
MMYTNSCVTYRIGAPATLSTFRALRGSTQLCNLAQTIYILVDVASCFDVNLIQNLIWLRCSAYHIWHVDTTCCTWFAGVVSEVHVRMQPATT